MAHDLIMQKWIKAGQGHIFSYWHEISSAEREKLINQISGFDLNLLTRVSSQIQGITSRLTVPGSIAPFPDRLNLSLISSSIKDQWENVGYDYLAHGRVAIIVMAGGQGTRLHCTEPKGIMSLGLNSNKTLLELQADRIWRLRQLVHEKTHATWPIRLPWYIMTSALTEQPIKTFFIEHAYFGLDSCDVIFFNQDILPAFGEDGRILMKNQFNLACSPNGNGGLWAALETSGVLADMKRRNIAVLSIYPVDNILIKVADPMPIGYLITIQADIVCKTIIKKTPDEKLGVFCMINERPNVLEYSEVESSFTREGYNCPPTNVLNYKYSHIGINNFSMSFVDKLFKNPFILKTLDFHLAKKYVQALNVEGQLCKQVAYKPEWFIFDVFPHANHVQVVEVLRWQEFSPLKNSTKISLIDTVESCRRHLSRLHKYYLRQAGITISNSLGMEYEENYCNKDEESDGTNCDATLCEISSRISYSGENLERLNKSLTVPCYLTSID